MQTLVKLIFSQGNPRKNLHFLKIQYLFQYLTKNLKRNSKLTVSLFHSRLYASEVLCQALFQHLKKALEDSKVKGVTNELQPDLLQSGRKTCKECSFP